MADTVKMRADEYVSKVVAVVDYPTFYVQGCWGRWLTSANIGSYLSGTDYNKRNAEAIKAAADAGKYYGFDCSCLLKAVYCGWTGDKKTTCGGASYNAALDTNADKMINSCSDISTDFKNIEIGEALWCSGHIGLYVGVGLAVECTPSFKGGVQLTAVKNIEAKPGYSARQWTKHGKLPFIDYNIAELPHSVEEDKLVEQLIQATGRSEAEVIDTLARLIKGRYATEPKHTGSANADFRLAKVMGLTDGTRPQDAATREEVAIMIVRSTKK